MSFADDYRAEAEALSQRFDFYVRRRAAREAMMNKSDRATFNRLYQFLRKLNPYQLEMGDRAEYDNLMSILQGCPTHGCTNLARDAGEGAPYCRECWTALASR